MSIGIYIYLNKPEQYNYHYTTKQQTHSPVSNRGDESKPLMTQKNRRAETNRGARVWVLKGALVKSGRSIVKVSSVTDSDAVA